MSLAPFAVLLEIDFALDKLAVLARPVIDAAALGAGQFEKLILRHNERNYTRIGAQSQCVWTTLGLGRWEQWG